MRTHAGTFPGITALVGLAALGLAGCAGSSPTPKTQGCDATASPMDTACVVTEDYGVFVDADQGNDHGTGTRGAPFKTLSAAAAAAAKTHKRVYACAGTYPEHLQLDLTDDGLEIYGGFDCATWKPGAGKTTVAPADAGPALQVAGTDGLRIEDVDLVAIDGEQQGQGSVGAIVDNALQVRLAGVGITAGAGVDGKNGPPFAVAQAKDGLPGHDGVAACTTNPNPGGAVVDLDCGTGTTEGGAGGAGGVSSSSSQGGNNGFPLIIDGNGGQGGSGSSFSCAVGGTGGGGQGGGDGTEGVDGAAGTGLGAIAGDGYHGADGGDGTNGGNGQGGGGGAGAPAPGGASQLVCSSVGINTGAGGGSGGTGGCGGLGGAGGQAGGSSIALISLDSGLVLDHCQLTAGTPGNGGSGAAGQIHGSGGQRGEGGPAGSGTDGCPGGNGGQGGNGGAGGGGQGGHSLGIAYYGHAPTLTSTTVIHASAGGPGGAGGLLGTPGNGGSDGVAADVQRF